MTARYFLQAGTAALVMAAGVAALTSGARAQQPAAAVTVDADDIGGVVSGPKGPEAGVWVIAETSDLPTKFVKIVVTDDRGRYLLPDLPKASYSVWVRGYGLIDSAEGDGSAPGRTVNLTATVAPDAKIRGALLSRRLLVLADARTGQGGVRRHRRRPPRHQSEHARPGRLDPEPEVGRLPRVPSAGQQGDARDPERARRVPDDGRRVGAPRPVGAGRRADGRRAEPVRPRAGARRIRELDRSHPRRRAAAAAAAPAGRRAQRRHHLVGLGRSEGVSPRRRLHRPAQPDGQRQTDRSSARSS